MKKLLLTRGHFKCNNLYTDGQTIMKVIGYYNDSYDHIVCQTDFIWGIPIISSAGGYTIGMNHPFLIVRSGETKPRWEEL